MSSIPLNGDAPLQYRIGTEDRQVGAATTEPENFIVLNQTNGKVFKVQGGVWVALAAGSFPNDLFQEWNATARGVQYRIGNTDRTIGAVATGYPEGFTVLNATTGNVFIVSGGIWTSGGNGTFPSDVYNAWLAA